MSERLSKPPCRCRPTRQGIVLVDGSQFVPAMETMLKLFDPHRRWFEEMFSVKSNAAVVASVVERAERLPRSLGEKLLLDMLRYDVGPPHHLPSRSACAGYGCANLQQRTA